jgi:hypothetical protein
MMRYYGTIFLLTSAILLGWTVNPSTGFVPTKFLAYVLNGLSFSFDSTITHRDMTRSAILEVASDVLIDNGNRESSQRIAAIRNDLTEENLVTAFYGERRRGVETSFENAIETIKDANSDVDLGAEEKIAKAHFDAETFQAGQNRLVELRQTIVSQILMENYPVARRETGRMLHTLQDFYSHSNWIENGNQQPYTILGKENARPRNIANPTQQTCNNCREAGTVIVGRILAFFSDRFESAHKYYLCTDNIESSLKSSGILTSGYHVGQVNDNRQEITKPSGKCSHGGFLDSTSDNFAKGGINKDSPFEKWSPHHHLYREAAEVAQEATINILQDIRRDVNNDELFSAYLGLTLDQAASIAYVIDTTGSMTEELPEIQATIPEIRTNLQQYVDSFSGNIQVRFILVPFNDPGNNYFTVHAWC